MMKRLVIIAVTHGQWREMLTISQAASEIGLPLSRVSRRASRSFFSLTCNRCTGVRVDLDDLTASHAQLE